MNSSPFNETDTLGHMQTTAESSAHSPHADSPGIGAAGEWNGSLHNSQALAGQAEVIDGKRLRDCRFGIKVPDLAPLRTPPDELRKTLHPVLVAVKKELLHFDSRTLVGHGSSGR